MKIFSLLLLLAAFFVFLAATPASFSAQTSGQTDFVKREEAYRANNLGVALLEQFNHKEAADQFRRALSLDPNLKLAQINLAIALYNIPDYEAASRELKRAAEIAPGFLQVYYIPGLIARTENRTDDAIANFKKVLAADPADVGANVNLGQIYIQRREYTEAVKVFRTAVEAEPYNGTALYNLATAMLRSGSREEGQKLMTQFQALRQSGAATNIGLNYLEQGRYAEAVASTGAENDLVDKTEPKVVFQSANIGLPVSKSKNPVKLFDKVAALLDFDDDGDLDIAQTVPAKLFRNDKGKYVDVTAASGDFARAGNTFCFSIVAGDYDNDQLIDLFVSWEGKYALYRNAGKGNFTDVTRKAKIPDLKAIAPASAFADVDHDGDLEIVLNTMGEFSNRLFRNNGDGSFTDFSESAWDNQIMSASALIPTDYDNRRDLDLLFLGLDAPVLLRNLRDGTFRDVAPEVGLEIEGGGLFCAAVGDFNKDSFVDFFFGRKDKIGVFAISDGRGKFVIKDAPKGTDDATAALFLDYDNDGLLDLVVNTTRGLVLSRNLGNSWTEASGKAFKTNLDLSTSKQILSADTDADGDLDLLVYAKNGTLQFLRNDGGSANKSFDLTLQGRVSNRTGIGAKIDLRAGSLTQKLESYSASPAPAPAVVHFGLGRREKPDAVRIIWTSGVIQAEVEFPDFSPKNQLAAQPVKIQELDRKPSSCPYLYTWNGERFEFISDFLGGGEMAYSYGNGQTNTPDADEYVRITSDQLKPRDGKYELRVTNELEEVLYLDRFELVAVDHAENTEVHPNEGLGIPTARQTILYTTRGEKPVLRATDGFGTDLTDRLQATDRRFYDTFESEKIRGYAKPHELILTLDDKRGFNGRTLLLLTGWTDYAFSSDNVAAAQAGLQFKLPKLQVRDRNGEWQTAIESIGFSVGRPQTVVVDLTGKFLSESREVRIVTNMKTLWDKAAVDVSGDAAKDLRVTKLNPQTADLRERGYSLEVKPDGKEPVLADYNTVLRDGRWKYFAGTFTRTGDVVPLVSQADDVFVISKTGDELALTFDAASLPPLEKGMKRTFLLYSVGYSKEMDINSASPDAVLPLPFRAMKKYPYGADEQFPMTDEKRRIYDEYTTRRVRTTLPRIESFLLK